MTQLNPPIPLDTPKGPAYAHMAIDYGQEHYLLFVCFLQESGECWIFPNREVKLQKNMTMGVRMPAKAVAPAPPPMMAVADCQCHADMDRLAAAR